MAKAELVLEFRDKVTAGLRNVEGQLKSLSKTASSVQFAAFVMAANAAIQVGKEIANVVQRFVEAGKEASKADIQFEATLRNLANATAEQIALAREYTQVLSHKLALDNEEVERLSALALSMGVQGKHLTKLLEVSRAYALATGVDIQTALQNLVKASEGVTTSLRRQGIFLDENRVKSEGMSYVLQEVGQRYAFVNEYVASGVGKYENLQHAMSDVVEEIGKAILNSKGFQSAIDAVISAISNGIPILELLSYVVSGIGYVVKYVVIGPLGTLVNLLNTLFQTVKGFITGGAKKAIEEFSKAWAETKEYVQEVYTGTKKTVEVADVFVGLQNKIAENLRETALLQGQISYLRTKTTQYDIEAYYIAQRNIPNYRKTVDFAKDLADYLKSAEKSLENAGKTLKDQASAELEKMKNTAEMLYYYASNFVNRIWEGVEAGRDLIDVLGEAVKELAIAVAKAVVFSALYKVIASAVGLPSAPIPAFQHGGVVDRPTLALVGEKEREYIIPESKFPQPVVYVEVRNANPDTYARVLVQMSKRAKRMVYSSLAGA